MNTESNYEERRQERREEERRYEADVWYEVWRAGGNPDRINEDRVSDLRDSGYPADDAARSEVQRQMHSRKLQREEEQAFYQQEEQES